MSNQGGRSRAKQRAKERLEKQQDIFRRKNNLLKEIRKYNDTALSTVCDPLLQSDDKSFIDKMKKILLLSENGVRISANQIGITKRVIIISPDRKTVKVMINPEIIDHSNETSISVEGCLSYPGIITQVPRYNRISVEYVDEQFNRWMDDFEGLAARIIAHETDHLNAICHNRDEWIKNKVQ